MKTLLIGANGQLGSDIVAAWGAGTTDNRQQTTERQPGSEQHELVALTHAEIEVTDPASVRAALDEHRPDLVINTSAFHNVDVCETEPERAFLVNAIAPMYVADACAEHGAVVMQISTDYVFSGKAGRAYTERDLPDAINVYGNAKAAGEQLIRTRHARHYIVRTSGLYGVAGSSGKGGNFVERMLQLARDGQEIRVVADQTLSPTFTADLAGKLFELVATGRYGTYHITNSGSTSWYDFARVIFECCDVDAKLSPTTTASFGAKAVRPEYSVLANEALAAAGIALLRPWREALGEYLVRKGHVGAKAAAATVAEG
jgi:dTDP-4-dehydrorhamnose reductase